MHKAARLIVPGRGEGNAEFHRCQGDALPDDPALCIMLQHRLAPRLIGAALLQLTHYTIQNVILDRLVIRRHIPPRPIEIRLADLQRVAAQRIGDLLDDPLTHHHTLRSAETAESGVRHRMGLHRARGQPHLGDVIGTVGVKQRPVGHRAGQIGAEPAARGQLGLDRLDPPVIVESDLVTAYEIMSFPGGRHILIAIRSDLHRPVPAFRGNRGDAGKEVHLAFLAAESAAHPPHVHHHRMRGHAQRMRHHVLRLAGMLGRTMHDDILILARHGKGDLAFQVHVLLSTDFHTGSYAMRRPRHPRRHIAAFQLQRHHHMRHALFQRRADAHHRILGRDLDLGQHRRPAGRIAALGHHREKRLAVKLHLVLGENRLVPGTHRADLVMSGHIRRGQNPHHPRCCRDRAQVHRDDPPMRHVRHAEIGVQRPLRPGDVVAIFRLPRDMLFRTVMRDRLMCQPLNRNRNALLPVHATSLLSRAACPAPNSAQNRRNRFCATSRR